ncbi:MAG: hypothetical protein ABIX01_17280 [Chitinophagaceae bacterium]
MRKVTGITYFLLLTVFCLPVSRAMAQDDSTYYQTDTVTTDSDIVTGEDSTNEEKKDTDSQAGADIVPILKQVPLDSINSIRGSKEFYYMAFLDSLLRAHQEAMKKARAQVESRTRADTRSDSRSVDNAPSVWDSTGFRYLFWLLGLVVVGFVIYKLFMGGGGAFTTNKSLAMPEVVKGEDIPENDLEGLLQRAIRNGQYRLAVRYQFLKTINKLGEKGILNLGTDKTNYQYASEIQHRPYAAGFAKICLQFEYVWFGEFELNKDQFENIRQYHQQFLKEI